MRVNEVFTQAKQDKKKLFIPYITCGDPTIEFTKVLVKDLVKIGADIIELGVPFSDPLADGPTNQLSAKRALESEVNIKDCCQLVQSLRDESITIPIVLFTYFNPIFKFGLDNLIDFAKNAKIDAVLIVDLPFEESESVRKKFIQNNIGFIQLVSETTSNERLNKIYQSNPEFLYYIARTGVTGVSDELSKNLEAKIKNLKNETNIPIGVGFGISTQDQAKEVASYADGVIVGSALVKMLENEDLIEAREKLCKLAKDLNEAIKTC